jgi:hypothetical protein
VSTPGTTPPDSRAATPQAPERPAPGSFRFMPYGTVLVWCSQRNPGSPWNHPVLVLPGEDLDSELVRVVFTTTKDVVEYCTAKTWGCNYLPLEGQLHPWREAIPFSLGSLKKNSSLNITTVYIVHWRDLEILNSSSADRPDLRLSAETVDKVITYVNAPYADIHTPLRTTAPANDSAALSNDSVTPASPTALDPVLPTFAALSVRDPVPAAALAPVSAQGTTQKYVPPHLRQASSMDSTLRPTAPEFQPHPALRSGPWRRSY